MPSIITVEVFKAGSLGTNIQIPSLMLQANTATTDEMFEEMSLDQCGEFYKSQAKSVVDAIMATLPGGTIDAILVELMQRRASLFRVRF